MCNRQGARERESASEKDRRMVCFVWGTECVSVQQRERDDLQTVHVVSWRASWCKSMSCIQRGKHSVRCVSANIQQMNNKGSHLNGPTREIPFPNVFAESDLCHQPVSEVDQQSWKSALSGPLWHHRGHSTPIGGVLVPTLWNYLIAKKKKKKNHKESVSLGGGWEDANSQTGGTHFLSSCCLRSRTADSESTR